MNIYEQTTLKFAITEVIHQKIGGLQIIWISHYKVIIMQLMIHQVQEQYSVQRLIAAIG